MLEVGAMDNIFFKKEEWKGKGSQFQIGCAFYESNIQAETWRKWRSQQYLEENHSKENSKGFESLQFTGQGLWSKSTLRVEKQQGGLGGWAKWVKEKVQRDEVKESTEYNPWRNMRATSYKQLHGSTSRAEGKTAPPVPTENCKGMTSTSVDCIQSIRSHVPLWVRGQGLVSGRRKWVFKPVWVGLSLVYVFWIFSHF